METGEIILGDFIPMNSIGGFIEDLCFKLGLLVTTRVSTRDKRIYMYIRLSPYNIDVAASTVSLYMYSFCGTDAFEKAC